jgi:glycosyltransferase involved in cell wall biosynthesis
MQWLRDNPCDVVSTHSSTDSWLSAIALLALGKPYPMVRTRHISAPVPRNVLSRWLYTRATRRIVTAGEALKQELVARNRFPAARIDSVPTGVDVQRFKPGGEKLAIRAQLGMGKGLFVGIVATLRSWKGHRYLIEALPPNTKLLIVGDGPQREALQRLVQQRELEKWVKFVGNQKDVVPWLQAIDIFALPSYANEGVPQALVQAMMVGLPCVTTAVGSIPELAKHGETALVVPPQDVPALRNALENLIKDESLRRRLGDAARRHAAANFSYEKMLDRMEAIYSSVAGIPLIKMG